MGRSKTAGLPRPDSSARAADVRNRPAGAGQDARFDQAHAYEPPTQLLNECRPLDRILRRRCGRGRRNPHRDDGDPLRRAATVRRCLSRSPTRLPTARRWSWAWIRTACPASSVAGVRIPVDDDGRMLVNFRRGAEPFPYYSDLGHHRSQDCAGKTGGQDSAGRRDCARARRSRRDAGQPRHAARRDPRQRNRQHRCRATSCGARSRRRR